MTASELRADGWTALRVLLRPARGLDEVAARPRAGAALLLATALALGAAAVVAPRTDHGAGVEPQAAAEGVPATEPTPFERAQAADTARKLGMVEDLALAAGLPVVLAGLAACALALAFRLAGAPVALPSALAATAHGMLPVWLARALAVPAAVLHAPIPRAEVPALLPSSLAALLPPGAPPALAGALGGLDLFALWAVALVAAGMARAAGTSWARALALTAALYAAWIALRHVAFPAFLAPPTP
jgi:hypothetical protein